jgi:endonuclease/exonuclease/phosphatase (EEP) superfamily protein YafD
MSIIGLLQAAAALTVVFSLLAALSLPLHFIDLFSHFRLQYFVVSALLLLVFALQQRYAYAGALLLTVLLNGYFLIEWYLPPKPDAGGSEEFKLLHANVLSSNNQHQRLIDLVAAEDPDMIFLQEITDDWLLGLRPLLKDYPFTYAAARSGNFGIAVYSRIPFDSVSHVDSPPYGHPTITATARIGKREVTLISSHPTIPLGKQLYSARNQHLDSLLDLIQAADRPVVFLGDLNATVWDLHLKKLTHSAGLANARQGFGVLPTWPTFMPIAMIPIDHVLVSEGISVTSMKTAKSIGSDHLPLIVTLSL